MVFSYLDSVEVFRIKCDISPKEGKQRESEIDILKDLGEVFLFRLKKITKLLTIHTSGFLDGM